MIECGVNLTACWPYCFHVGLISTHGIEREKNAMNTTFNRTRDENLGNRLSYSPCIINDDLELYGYGNISRTCLLVVGLSEELDEDDFDSVVSVRRGEGCLLHFHLPTAKLGVYCSCYFGFEWWFGRRKWNRSRGTD